MFSGIIQAIGEIKTLQAQKDNIRTTILCPALDLSQTNIGDSIAVDGVCLTIIKKDKDSFCIDVSKETVNCTQFANYRLGHLVNLEKALKLSQGINGHLVNGHIDGVGVIDEISIQDQHYLFKIKMDKKLLNYCIQKGSICVNGISLTINNIINDTISLNIIPHTFSQTNLSDLSKGDKVNIEVDMMAKYVQNFLKKSSYEV